MSIAVYNENEALSELLNKIVEAEGVYYWKHRGIKMKINC